MTEREVLDALAADERGADTDEILGAMDRLREAGYEVALLTASDGRRVYRATDPETGERQQVNTVPSAVTDWRAVTGVAMLWGLR
ncbi:MAG: hypothetical protein AAGI37_12580 [Planctomycetota bacterium]